MSAESHRTPENAVRTTNAPAAEMAAAETIERLRASLEGLHFHHKMFEPDCRHCQAACPGFPDFAPETGERHPFGNGTRESLKKAMECLRFHGSNGDANQIGELLAWLGPDTRYAEKAASDSTVTLPCGCPAKPVHHTCGMPNDPLSTSTGE